MDIKFGEKKKLIFLAGGLFLASFLLLPSNVLAYNSQTTHPDLTREIITFYELSTGKKLTDEQKQWIIQGSIDEDKAPRWLNHFYDPAFERGLSTTAAGFGYAGYPAKNWAQFSSYQTLNPANLANLWTGQGPVISGSWWGDFSYEAALKHYSQSKEKEAYIALGSVLHLVKDMTVPEHVRNEAHPAGSFYETWAMNNSAGLTQDLGKRVFNQGWKPVVYGGLEIYFNELANYTNTHFFSPRTINSEIYQKPKIVYEDGTFAYGSDENYQLFDLAYIEKDFITKKVIYNVKKEQIIQEYWTRLSRQALVNGAGIIGLFVNQAEAAKKVELAKQKVDAGSPSSPQNSFIGFISGLFSSSPGDASPEPAMTIIAGEPKLAVPAPKINPPAVQTPAASPPAPVTPKATPAQIPAPSTALIVAKPATSTSSNLGTGTPTPTPAPVVVYGGGGGGTAATPTAAVSTQDNTGTGTTFAAGNIVINEIMYDLEGSDTISGKSREWIELYNNSSLEIDINGWKFNDGDDDTNHSLYAPPKNGGQGSMILSVGGYAILAENAETFLTVDHIDFTGTVIDTVALNLKDATSTVTTLKIIAPDETIIDEVTYYNSWGANGDGKSLERIAASGNSNDATNWGVSSAIGGTPGAVNNPIVAGEGGPVDGGVIFGTAGGTDVLATTTISQNTTWTLANSPYRLFFDTTNRPMVNSGVTLTIEPGVKIIPQTSGATVMEIKGTLNATATSGAPIIFTSIADADGLASTTPQKGDWLNIVFSAGSNGNLDYVEFLYGGGQNITAPFYEMVNVASSTININHSKFENSKYTALYLKDSSGVVQNSIFSDNNCGISVDSSNGFANSTYGNCYGFQTTGQILSSADLQIKNNQFIRNQIAGIEVRSGTAPTIDSNIFSDNGYPIKIESSYPSITNSQLTNTATSTNIISGIAISGYTHFSYNLTLKKDLPYILETNGPALAPYIDAGATLTIEPGTILKTENANSAIFVNGSLISNGTLAAPITFTSLKDVPQNGDWGNIRFNAGSVGNLTNTNFYYGTVSDIFPNNPNLPATSIISQCSAGDQPSEYSFGDVGSKIAFSFTPLSNVDRGQIIIPLRKASSSPGSLRIAIETDASGNPSGSSLSSTDIDQSSLDFIFKNFKLPFGVGIGNSSLVASTTYWMVVENIGGPDGQFYIKNSGSDTCPAIPKFRNSTSAWGESFPADIAFRAEKIESFLPVIVDAGATVVVE